MPFHAIAAPCRDSPPREFVRYRHVPCDMVCDIHARLRFAPKPSLPPALRRALTAVTERRLMNWFTKS